MSISTSRSSASWIAFITVGGAAIVPASPTPFAPMGFSGDGVTVRLSSKAGSSGGPETRYGGAGGEAKARQFGTYGYPIRARKP